VDKIAASLRSGGSPFAVLPTGAGKMVIIAALASLFDVNVLIVEHRIELIDQAIEKLNDFGISPGLVVAGKVDSNLVTSGKVSLDHNCRIKVAMIQTVNRRDLGDWSPGFIIVDEAHLSAAKSYVSLIERFSVPVVGFSATPSRLDGKGFSHIFSEIIVGPTIAQLTESGFLVPVEYMEYDIADFSDVKTIAGEYDQEQVGRILDKFSEDIVDTWIDGFCDRPTVVFASDIKQSKRLCDWFRRKGFESEHIDGSTPDSVRKSVIHRLRSGATKVLCNCGIVIEGFDAPLVSCVAMATATMSVSKFLQCCGRGMRPHSDSGKKNLVVLDFGGNSKIHGYPGDDRVWSLEPRNITKRERWREYIETEDEVEKVEPERNRYIANRYDYGVNEEFSVSRVKREEKSRIIPGSRPPPRYLPRSWIDWWWSIEEYRVLNRYPREYSEDLARKYLIHGASRVR